jgi:hypothetical protein
MDYDAMMDMDTEAVGPSAKISQVHLTARTELKQACRL